MRERLRFLGRVENRRTFFRRIAKIYHPSDWRYKKIRRAYQTAKDAFRGKYRETGERYFEHLRRTGLIQIVMLYLDRRPEDAYILICAALLHDIVEDIDGWTVRRVERLFGKRIARLVWWMTKYDKDAYHRRFKRAPRDFFLVKLPDRLDNMLTIWGCSRAKIMRKIRETEKYYLPYAEKHLILVEEFREAIERAKEYAKIKAR